MHQQDLRETGRRRTAARRQGGFTIVQVIVVMAVASVVCTFAIIGVTRARASIRLTGSARVLASYLERARADAVRRRSWARVTRLTNNSYRVEMDLNGDGALDTRDVTLEEGVAFNSVWTEVSYNWRGRIDTEVAIGLENTVGTSAINVSGSGDVTLDSEVFEDASIPGVGLNSAVAGDLDGTANIGNVNTSIPNPTPPGGNTNTNSGTTTNTNANTNPNTNTNTNTNSNSNANTNSNSNTNANTNTNSNSNANTNSNSNANTNTNSNANTNTNTNSNTNSNTNTNPPACALSVSASSLTISQNGSKTVTVTYSNMASGETLTAKVSSAGQFQVAPTTKTVSGSGTVDFTVTVKKQNGSVTISTTKCGVSKVVSITVP